MYAHVVILGKVVPGIVQLASHHLVCLGFDYCVLSNSSVVLPTAYRLYTVVPKLVKFVDMLTNWYVRTNRRRLKVRSPSKNKRQRI